MRAQSTVRNEIMAVVGAGPAGLRAAEVAVAGGARVVLCDAQPSAGRKFLVAGRGGLNLTHSEPVENFPARYRAEPERWRDLLAEFGPNALRAWAEELAIETYVGTSKRVFPRGQKAAAAPARLAPTAAGRGNRVQNRQAVERPNERRRFLAA